MKKEVLVGVIVGLSVAIITGSGGWVLKNYFDMKYSTMIKDEIFKFKDTISALNKEISLQQKTTSKIQSQLIHLNEKKEIIDIPIGSIFITALPKEEINTLRGWLLCDGRTISEHELERNNAFPEIRRLLTNSQGKAIFGSDEEIRVPDFQGMVPIGSGYRVYTYNGQDYQTTNQALGDTIGQAHHFLSEEEMPYTHILALTDVGDAIGKFGSFFMKPKNDMFLKPDSVRDDALHGQASPFERIQPSLAINFILKAK